MGCPHVRGDNPTALASVLSYVQVYKHGITILYHQHQWNIARHKIFQAKCGVYVYMAIFRLIETLLGQ